MSGRSVVITGAASGIGRAASERFVADGERVIGVDVELDGLADGVTGFPADVSDPLAVERAIAFAVATNDGIDVLCNNAGVASTTSVLDCTFDEWERVFAINARGVFLGTKYALPHMLASGGGVIVNTASIAGMIGLPDRAAYCASKGAVIALTKQVAIQWATQGIRCNCVCPGTVDSPWVGRLLEASNEPETLRAQLIARQPLGRLGTPEEIAAAIVYLASADAAFMTGTALVIDGGVTAG
jgi:NAD(P)-dependent dehydrogenase (short-subunit alcohol dehydrogenase family)